jgi:hypothetical protein
MGRSVHPGHLIVDRGEEFVEPRPEAIGEQCEGGNRGDGMPPLDGRDERARQWLAE